LLGDLAFFAGDEALFDFFAGEEDFAAADFFEDAAFFPVPLPPPRLAPPPIGVVLAPLTTGVGLADPPTGETGEAADGPTPPPALAAAVAAAFFALNDASKEVLIFGWLSPYLVARPVFQFGEFKEIPTVFVVKVFLLTLVRH